MPAATSAPNTIKRMISVTGIESSPAFFRSSMKAPSTSLDALAPKAPTKKSGCASCAAVSAARIGSSLSSASSASPRIWKSTRTERSSAEIWPAFSDSSGERTFCTTSIAVTFATTSSIAAWNAGSSTVSVSLWIRMFSPAGCWKPSSRIRAARPDSPTPDVAASICVVPFMIPSANARITKANQPKMAVLRCRALQRPMRPAMLVWRRGASGAWPATPASGSSWMMRVFMSGSSRGIQFTLPPEPSRRKAGDLPIGGRVSGVLRRGGT